MLTGIMKALYYLARSSAGSTFLKKTIALWNGSTKSNAHTLGISVLLVDFICECMCVHVCVCVQIHVCEGSYVLSLIVLYLMEKGYLTKPGAHQFS